jgi:hypothetical protein
MEYIKYPSTPYIPFSESIGRPVIDIQNLLDKPLVITEKMDGSNVVLTSEHVGARNAKTAEHKSFDMLKKEHASIKYLIPDGIQIFGEWLYAKHSIHYTKDLSLKSFLYIFHVYNTKQRSFYPWSAVKMMARSLGYPCVPIIKEDTTFSTKEIFTSEITKIAKNVIKEGREGIVIRVQSDIKHNEFETHTGKYVRPNHVQTDEHWRTQKLVRNEVV